MNKFVKLDLMYKKKNRKKVKKLSCGIENKKETRIFVDFFRSLLFEKYLSVHW